jgi:hypothetical protein
VRDYWLGTQDSMDVGVVDWPQLGVELFHQGTERLQV